MNTMETLTQILLLTLTAVLLYILYKRALRLLTRDRVSADYGHIVGVSLSASGDLKLELEMPVSGSGSLSIESGGRPLGGELVVNYVSGSSSHFFSIPVEAGDSELVLILKFTTQTIRRKIVKGNVFVGG